MRELYPDDVPEDDPKPAAAAQPEKEEAPAAVPAGEYQLTAPEGFEVAPDMLKEATPVFRELGLSNEHANKLMPLGARLIEQHESAKNDEFAAVKADWSRQTVAAADLGGPRWKDTERLMGIALTAAGVGPKDEFTALMSESGLGNHPAVVRAFRNIGQALSRKGIASGARRARAPDRAEVLYPDDIPNRSE